MIRVPGLWRSSGAAAADKESKKRKKKSSAPPVRSKRVYIVAGVLAVIIFASIIALSVALSGMRDKSSDATPTTPVESEDILDTWPELGEQDNPGNPIC